MTFYARSPRRLFWQLLADIFVLVWSFAWWFAGRALDATIRAVAEPGRQTARLASELSGQLAEAATQAGTLPLVGEGLRRPFDAMAASLGDLATSAGIQATGIEHAATLVGWSMSSSPWRSWWRSGFPAGSASRGEPRSSET